MPQLIKKTIAFMLVFFLFTGNTALAISSTSTSDDLKSAIETRAKDLERINAQISQTQQNLTQTKSQSRSLQKDIQQITSNIGSLTLKIKADEINIDKLGLEVTELNGNIEDIKQAIDAKRESIAAAVRALQQHDDEALIITLLKTRSIAESIAEAQSLSDLNSGLKTEIDGLKNLNDSLNQKLDATSDKLGEIKVENENLKNRKSLIQDQKSERERLLSMSKSQEAAYNSQLNKLAQEQEDIAKEIEQMESVLRQKINNGLLPTSMPGVLLFPVPGGRITQGYGQTDFALATYKGQWHNGIDIGKFLGAEVVAAEGGVVVNMGNQDLYCRGAAYGKYIVIKHNNGLTTLYGHLSKQVVSQGQTVKRGDLIGYMGRTGWATGVHTHFTVYDSTTYVVKQSRFCGPMPIGGDLNPLNYVSKP